METRDDNNKRPTPKIVANNGGVDGDDLHARLFDLLTAADEEKRFASQPPVLGSPFRTPVLALRGLSRPQSIYPSDSISMIRSRSRTGGTDVDPGEGEVGAAAAAYAAYEETTARDSEGVTVGPDIELAATSQPSVSGWAPARAIVPQNMQRHRERLDRLNDETVHNIIGELRRETESAELADAGARLERSESKLRDAKLRLVREQLLRTTAEQATASHADEARNVKAELATAVRALRKARDEGKRNDDERRRATRAFEEARDRLVKYHEELKVRDARAAGKEEGRTEAWKEAERWLGGSSSAPPAPQAPPALVWAVEPGQKSAPVYGLVQQVPMAPAGSFQQVPLAQPAFQPVPQQPAFQGPQPTQPSVAQEFQAQIQHTPSAQQWLPSQINQQSFQPSVPLTYAQPQPYPAPNQQYMPPTAAYTPVPRPIQTARNTPLPHYPPTRPSSERFPPPPGLPPGVSLPPDVPPPAIRLSTPPDTLPPIIAPIPELPVGAAQAYLDDLEHNRRRNELLAPPRTRTPHRRSVSASAAQFTETWPTEPRPPTHTRSSSQPENSRPTTRLADPDLHPHLHRETSSNLDSRYPLFVPSAPGSTHSRTRGSSDPPPQRNSQLNPAFYPLPPSSVGSGVSRAKSARSATRSRMAGAIRDNTELDQLHKIEETDEPAFDPRQPLPGAYPASSRHGGGRPRSRVRPHPSMPSPLRSEVGVGSRPRLSTVHEDEYVQRQTQRAQQQQQHTDTESSPRLASEAPTILVQPPVGDSRKPSFWTRLLAL
ncbi:uncharacterized protein LOC62_07G009391 [Vanrija pseudolonga]|uniref:Uncharacterized protein n=1 Tax=Vanrija pseudolonga TaxID=143232 RepID=A0AAF1BQ21_9TREE|nr:hypothetical protein LOC62_07G009391 [Vanrija pseudolonga]